MRLGGRRIFRDLPVADLNDLRLLPTHDSTAVLGTQPASSSDSRWAGLYLIY